MHSPQTLLTPWVQQWCGLHFNTFRNCRPCLLSSFYTHRRHPHGIIFSTVTHRKAKKNSQLALTNAVNTKIWTKWWQHTSLSMCYWQRQHEHTEHWRKRKLDIKMAMINDATDKKKRQKLWKREYKSNERNVNHKLEPVSEGLESRDFPNGRDRNFWCYSNIFHC